MDEFDVETPEVEEKPEEGRPKATLDLLKKKQKVIKTVPVVVTGDDGEPVEVELTFQAISAPEYDKLVSQYPPDQKHRKMGLNYHPEKFAPVLLSRVCIDPEMTEDDAREIWNSDNWNRGERMGLLMAAIQVCTAGLDVPFTEED